jgi:hypothetical protein
MTNGERRSALQKEHRIIPTNFREIRPKGTYSDTTQSRWRGFLIAL